MAAHAHAHRDQESAPLREVLRERLIQVGTMRVELRLIVGLAIAQLLVAGILLGLKEADTGPFAPSIYAFPADSGNGFQLISTAAFVIGVVVTTAAWAYVLAGAFRAGVVVRLAIVAAFGWAFASERDALNGLDMWVTYACLALVSFVGLLAVVTYLPERRLHAQRRAEGHDRPGAWRWVRRLEVPVLFVVVGLLYLLPYLASASVDAANPPASVDASQVSFFSNDVFDQVDNLQYLLIPLLVLAGADFGEWGQLVVARTARRVRGFLPAPLFGLIAVVAGGLIAYDGFNVAAGPDYGGIGQEAVLGTVVVLIAAGLYFLAKPRGGWSSHVPFMGIAAVAILDTVSGFVTQQLQGESDHLGDYITIASASLWVVGGVLSLLALVALRGRLSPGWTAALCFVVLIGVTDLLQSMYVLGNFDNAPLGITADSQPYLGPEGIAAVFGALAVVVVAVAAVRRRLEVWRVPISIALVTAVTMEVLRYIDLLYTNKSKLEEAPPIAGLAIGGTVILVGALLWDLMVSGEAITNVEGRHFPRDTRVLMFVGYILMVSSAVLLFASLHDQSGKLLESSFDPESWVQSGILFLGIPLVMTMGIGALHRWRDAAGADEVAARAGH